jgi:sulfur-oxidizing protein SoxX
MPRSINLEEKTAMKKLPCFVITLAGVLGAMAAAAAEPYCSWEADNYGIDAPLCGLSGDPERGRVLAYERKKGNCLACHTMPIPEEQFHGTIGPNLAGVGSRYSEGQLRLRLVDMKVINPVTLMPGFYKNPDELSRVKKEFQGQTPLTAQEIEDVVAYLETLQ